MFTQDDLEIVATKSFGDLGAQTAKLFAQYNADYFDGRVQPVPVLYVPTSPYGHWVGQAQAQKLIYVMFPGNGRDWDFTRSVLLHEMLHHFLYASGENSKHAGKPWAREVIRLSAQIWGRQFVKVSDKIRKIDGHSVRIRAIGEPRDGVLAVRELACWPHSIGEAPPDLHGYVATGT
jgi:hypothetical protein